MKSLTELIHEFDIEEGKPQEAKAVTGVWPLEEIIVDGWSVEAIVVD